MSREELVDMARRTLEHARQATVPLADDVFRVAASTYTDPDRWRLEMERVFKRVPLMLGFSAELAGPGSYKALEAAGVPVLLVRGADGAVRAFVNMCSHRGAQIVEPGFGEARRFTCPYHAWSYDQHGDLVGILDRADFGAVDVSCLGLVALPVGERAGMIFVNLTPGEGLDLDTFLCGYDKLLEFHDFANCQVIGRQSVAGPAWKVAFDGYLDFYHLPILHKNTFGADYCNKSVYDTWGPHARNTQPDDRIRVLDVIDESEWPLAKLVSGIWTIFPHISIAAFDAGGKLYMVSQLLPGDTPGSSVTVQTFLTAEPVDDARRELIEQRMAFLFGVVRDEDYATGLKLQKNIATGLKKEVLFGRNEYGGQRFHQWVQDIVDAPDTAALTALFASAKEFHQS